MTAWPLKRWVHRLEEGKDVAKEDLLGEAMGLKDKACWVPCRDDGGGNAAALPSLTRGWDQATKRGKALGNNEGTALSVRVTMCRQQQCFASGKQGCVGY